MVSSKYKNLQLGLVIVFSIFFILISLIFLAKSHNGKGNNGLIVYFFLVSFYLWYLLLNKSPRIYFDESFITIKRVFSSSVYSWSQVTNVLLSTKENYSVLFIFGHALEAMKLKFDDGKALIVWGDMYENMSELREFVAQKLNDKIHFLNVPKNKPLRNLLIDKRYAGNVWTTFNTFNDCCNDNIFCSEN